MAVQLTVVKLLMMKGAGSQEPEVVARSGFEPLISALRGRCPRPLDERAGRGASPCKRPGGAETYYIDRPHGSNTEVAVLH